MRLEIRPNEGVGPVKFGMTRAQVGEAMSKKPDFTRLDSDSFDCLKVVYSTSQTVEFIEASAGSTGEFIYEGVDVFDTPAKRLLTHIARFDKPDPQLSREGFEYVFPKLILSLWGPEKQYDHKRHRTRPIFGAVGIGNADYLREIREIKAPKSPIDIEWPKENQPASKHRSAVTAWKKFDATIGIDDEGEVRSLSFFSGFYSGKALKVGNDELKLLKGFTRLEALNLNYTSVTDAGLLHLNGLTNLRALFLTGDMTDAGLKHLSGLRNLVDICLSEKVTADGFKVLLRYRKLRCVRLKVPKDAEAGLRLLKELPALRMLDFADNLTDSGLKLIGQITQLERLDIESCRQITNEGLKSLKKLINLRELHLSSRIGDPGLVHLKNLEKLKKLVAFSSRITERGIARLRQSLPRLIVRV